MKGSAARFSAVQRRDLDAVARLQHDDVEDDFVAIGVYRGKPAVRGFFEELFAALPDFTLTPDRILAHGEHATVQWRISGTFSGAPFQGVHATGRKVELRGIDVVHIVNGLLVDNTVYYDMLSFARQIGMLPSAGSRGDRAVTSTSPPRSCGIRAGINPGRTRSGDGRSTRLRFSADLLEQCPSCDPHPPLATAPSDRRGLTRHRALPMDSRSGTRRGSFESVNEHGARVRAGLRWCSSVGVALSEKPT